jgi:hypothetical protein
MRIWLALLACGCPGGGGVKGPQPDQDTKALLGRLEATRKSMTSFKADTTMDYWFNGQKVKGEVLVMGASGSKVRINAINPVGETVLADLACDGQKFYYINFQANCELTGPCTRQSIAQLLNVEAEPDDFLHLALGTPPVIDGDGALTWDASAGQEHVELKGPAGTQTLAVDGRDGRTDVVSSKLVGPDGKMEWQVDNKDFTDVSDAKGGKHRRPGKTRFQTSAQNGDLIIDWNSVEVNVDIEPKKFVLALQGLPACGVQQQVATPQPASSQPPQPHP